MTMEKPKPRRPTRKKTEIARVRTDNPRMQAWMSGELTAEGLDDDEVFRMQLRDRNGNFQGRPPRVVPRDLAEAFRTEAQKRLMGWFVEQVPNAQKAVEELVRSRHLLPGDATRLRAAEGIFERVIGKVGSETHLIVDKGKTFEDFVGEAIIDVEEDED